MTKCVVYIDEAGDLGFRRGTKWFVLTGVIVEKEKEPMIRARLAQIKARLNVNNIHLRQITDYYRRAYIVREIDQEDFVFINIIADTDKLDQAQIGNAALAYNYLCRMLLERVTWYLRDHECIADVVLSARGTKRDGELITYINEKLLPYRGNQIVADTLKTITVKSAGSWDLLQLADICATSTFLAYEINGWEMRTPCFLKVLSSHLYRHDGTLASYGIKYFTNIMQPPISETRRDQPCTKKERTPGATTT